MEPDPSAADHPAQQWITETFGRVDPFHLVEDAKQGRGWQPVTGLDGRSVVEEKTFIVLGVALERHGLPSPVLDQLARKIVLALGSSPEVAAEAVELLLSRWPLSRGARAHLIAVLSRIARDR